MFKQAKSLIFGMPSGKSVQLLDYLFIINIMEKLTPERRRILRVVVVDLIMVGLLIINLLWIVWDGLYSFEFMQEFLANYASGIKQGYKSVHKDFMFYDLTFVAIFLVELLIRWLIAIKRRTYHRWFYYPFVHWYDVLGCIPVGSFRFLRVLRVFSIVYRFQKLQLIDITRFYLYQLVLKYWSILMEEITDRVVVKIVEEAQDEISRGTPIGDKIVEDIVMPHKNTLVDLLATRFGEVLDASYQHYEPVIQDYANDVVGRVMNQNREVQAVKQIPMLGTSVTNILQTTISSTVNDVVKTIVNDLADRSDNSIIHEASDVVMHQLLSKKHPELNAVLIDVIHQSLEIVKEQISIKQWRLDEQKEKEDRLRKRLEKEFEQDRRKWERRIENYDKQQA